MSQFRLRNEQIQLFEDIALEEFITKLLAHLREFFPEPCDSLGEIELRQVCRYGARTGKRYGLESEQDLCKYLNLMFVFGWDFDTNPTFPWAQRILNDPDVSGPTLRINRLYLEAQQHAHEGEGLRLNETFYERN